MPLVTIDARPKTVPILGVGGQKLSLRLRFPAQWFQGRRLRSQIRAIPDGEIAAEAALWWDASSDEESSAWFLEFSGEDFDRLAGQGTPTPAGREWRGRWDAIVEETANPENRLIVCGGPVLIIQGITK